ncbi:ADP-ribosylglycohydrolase family protein [Paeniroseomonas aquatica]|uniref:ADP-ribosylglycohydrolase family protein n=1 Tax=Paeniroseomonas aquatica TaxID=373043 RepID=UPI0036243080
MLAGSRGRRRTRLHSRFTARDELPHHADMAGKGPFDLEPGQWTDDTSMALALTDSLVTCHGLDAADLMTRFLAWRQAGDYSCTGECFDIGTTTSQALSRFRRNGNAYAGSVAEDSAGNGSLMRVAPVALYALHDPVLATRLARDQSRTTHGAPQAVEACDLFVSMLRSAILGTEREVVLAPRHWDGHAAIRHVAAGAWRNKSRASIRSTGYVVDTLEAALWSVGNTGNFEDALVLAVNLAGDADTVGAVAGQLAGAVYGASAIPKRWLQPLAWRHKIEAMGQALLETGPRPTV